MRNILKRHHEYLAGLSYTLTALNPLTSYTVWVQGQLADGTMEPVGVTLVISTPAPTTPVPTTPAPTTPVPTTPVPTTPVPTTWSPDLSKQDTRIIAALLLRF